MTKMKNQFTDGNENPEENRHGGDSEEVFQASPEGFTEVETEADGSRIMSVICAPWRTWRISDAA